MHVKPVEAQSLPVGVVWQFGEGSVSSSSLERGLKLRSPSPIASPYAALYYDIYKYPLTLGCQQLRESREAMQKGSCQVIYSQFGLAIHQNKHQARRRFIEWAQNEIAVVPDFHKRILFSDEAHFWLNGYVNKQSCRIWSEANPQVYVETPLHPEKLTVWCALWAGGIIGSSSKTMKATTLQSTVIGIEP
ncbi:hypothetical protein TNCV_1110741 [Trichonephila clavipes]|nr:hypothetical protein TNCV_1110741 [Trichonephila clavipes]